MSAVLQRQKPHASAAAETLRAAALKPYEEALKDVVGSVARAVIKLRSVDDLIEVYAAVNQLSLAAEALETAAEALHDTADAALVASMVETGCTAFATASHTVSLRDGAPSVLIAKDATVPAKYMSTPQPSPDKAKIRAAIKNGTAINWATLQPGNPFLSRKALT
jgi:hypothetical protein